MKKRHIYIFLTISLIAIFSCSKMNDIHGVYLEDGERVYIGKLDSLKVFPGNERVKFTFWVSDPRAKSVNFYWVPDDDSIHFELERTAPTDSFEIVIGGNGSAKTIAEGNYTLQAVTSDDLGNYSLPFETTINVYGEKYQSSLINRVVNSSQYNRGEGTLELAFSGAFNNDDAGIEIKFTDEDGALHEIIFRESVLSSPVTLSGIDVSKGVNYRTMYLPVSTAIDTFYTDYSSAEIITVNNVALNKPTLTSGNNSADLTGDKAVDGIILTNASRWVSPASGEHWLEIDLEEDFAISGFKTWTGASGNLSHPTPYFIFQAEVDGEWIDIVEVEDSEPEYETTFPEITTSKVRYFVPDYDGNRVRLYEIEVYSVIRY